MVFCILIAEIQNQLFHFVLNDLTVGFRMPADGIRDPYVLEFLDLNPNPNFYEKDLEWF